MKTRNEPLCAFIVAFLCVSFTFALTGIYPFGSLSLIKMDLLHAYAPDFLEIRRALVDDNCTLYSWSGMLGRNLLNGVVTEAASPLNLMLLLFPEQYQTDFFSVITLLKIPCASMSFCLYIQRRLKCEGTAAISLSIAYAFCSYITAFHFNIMWLDTVIALPLVFLGIDEFLDRKGVRLYLLALTYAIFTGYGTAFQLCFFCVLYLLCGCILRKEYSLRSFLKFGVSSLLAVGICAITLFVVVDSFDNSQYLHERVPDFALNFSPIRFLAAHFLGGFPSVRFYSESVPNVCTGVLTLVLVPVFLSSRQISLREKLTWFAFISTVAACFFISIPTYILHGFHLPVMFPHRYSYVYSFALLSAAARAYSVKTKVSAKKAALLAVGLCVFAFVLFLLAPQRDAASVSLHAEVVPDTENEIGPLIPGRISSASLVLNVALICIYAMLLWALGAVRQQLYRRILTGLMLVLVCAESVISGVTGIGYLQETNRSWFNQDQYNDMRVITTRLRDETKFYRAEFHRNRSQSDSRVYGYNGFSALNATSGGYPDGLEELLWSLGVSSSFNNLIWNDPSPVLSSLFAQKYLLDAGTLLNEKTTSFQFKECVGRICVYENKNVLPIGFAVPFHARIWEPDGEYAPFLAQNELFGELSGQADVFSNMEPNLIQTENLKFGRGEGQGKYIFQVPDYLSYDDIASGVIPRAILRYTSNESGFISFCIRGTSISRVIARINGETVSSLSVPLGNTSLNAGFVESGDVVELILDLDAIPEGGERELVRQGLLSIYAARLDMVAYAQGITQLSERGLSVDNYDRTHIVGTISCDEKCLLWTSIPYDHNWHVVMDGKKVQPICWGDALLSVELPPGNHKLEFEYRMDALPVASGISLTALVLSMILLYSSAKSKKGRIKGGS